MAQYTLSAEQVSQITNHMTDVQNIASMTYRSKVLFYPNTAGSDGTLTVEEAMVVPVETAMAALGING